MADEASILLSKPKRKDINKYSELGEKLWYALGTELEIDDEELDDLEEKYKDDPHKRLLKMFGVWLKKGENPTYRKLLKALVNIGKRDVAESICTEIGLTSSLDSLLKQTTSQDKQMEEADTKPSDGKKNMPSHMTSPDSTHSQSKVDSLHTVSAAGSMQHSKATGTTVSYDSETLTRELNQSRISTLFTDASTGDSKNSEVHYQEASASLDIIRHTEPAHKVMIRYHDKLVTALSTDLLSVTGVLVANEFVPAEILNEMLSPSTPQEKATRLVIAITEKIKLVPSRFQELIKILSAQVCTKDIVPSLSPPGSREQVVERRRQDIGMIASTDQQHAICEGHMYTAWASLDPDDKINLEARLLTEAEKIGVKFAHLCTQARDSFEERGISPQVLTDTLMDLTVYKPGSSCHDIKPLLKDEGGSLKTAQSVREIFNALRPHMSFFNYEILQFLIEGKGSKADKAALATYLEHFTEFCKRHVFEVPFTTYSNGHQLEDESHNKQRLHVKVTDHFKAALLIKSTTEALASTSNESQAKNICSSKLGISLEDAKNIQRKIANILDLNPASVFLDSISEGSVILTFLLPTCVSLTGLDDNPEIVQLSSNGISILCGPPGQLKLIDLTPSGLIMRWSQPEYGCESLTQYTVYYRKKEESEWQVFELDSLNTHTRIPDLSDGDIYVFKICTVSDGGTSQYGDESDPIVISADGILTNNIHKVIAANKDMLASAFSSVDPNKFAAKFSFKRVIPKEDAIQISLTSTPSDKVTLLVTVIERQIKRAPGKFQDFLNTLHKDLPLPDDIVAILKLWSDYYNKTSAFSLADPNTIAAVLSNKGIISKHHKTQISLASTPSQKATLVTIIEHQMQRSPITRKNFFEFLNALSEENLSLPDDVVEPLWLAYILTSAFSSDDPDIIAVLSIKGIISKEDEAEISLASTLSEKATLLTTALKRQIKSAPEKFQDSLNAKLILPGDVVETLWSDYYDSVYKQYLDYLYASLENKQKPSDQWPPSATKKFFRLAMIQSATVQRGYIENHFIKMTITGKVDDILRAKYPIQLKDIFKETERQIKVTKENINQRKVILLEGAPGCGKSTLSMYICQQWEKGQLFNQFKLVIFVRLRDPEVKNAKGIADLLPCLNAKTTQLLAGVMMEMKCQDVLFILDGWDELPSNLRKKSIFGDLVSPYLPSSNPLSKSTVIVTSRPIVSGDLHQVVSSRVEILGFTAEELHQFFTECLKGDTEAVKTLQERIEENPEVAGSCYLPLNATILVHLFKSDCNTLPTTLYGIFSSLVLNCIKRHLKLRTQYKDVSIESLDQLPEFAKKPFSILCRLAYDGVMEDKIIFTSLPADVNTLSLLQGVESFIGQEKAVSHNFLHLSIQELLAAWYIATQLPASEQVSKFNELFDKSRFSAVFRFYAAITKLKTPGIKKVVINVVKKYESTHKEGKVLMVSLLHCLYEAQDPSLCKSVVQQLQHRLELGGTTLTPSDCLCIGYFLAHVCKMDVGEFRVNLSDCSIDDQGCKYLVSGLHKYLDTHGAVITLLHMDIMSNAISHHGLQHVSILLQIGCVNYLELSHNNLQSEQDTAHTTFGTFAEQLKNNTTLKTLWLQKCGLNSWSAESLSEALTTNKHLEKLYIPDNALCDNGIQHLAHALRVNRTLKLLSLVSCGMTDGGLECLAKAKSLQHNKALKQLNLFNNNTSTQNRLTEKIIPVLTECLQNNHTLTELVLPKNLKSSTTNIEKAVNDARKRRGLPLIEVTVGGYKVNI